MDSCEKIHTQFTTLPLVASVGGVFSPQWIHLLNYYTVLVEKLGEKFGFENGGMANYTRTKLQMSINWGQQACHVLGVH